MSEPMGTLLVNERMLETYLYARDHFLKPGGKMWPQIGRIHVAAFSDEQLYMEVLGKSYFWLQQSFYGVNITDLYGAATESYFAQVGHRWLALHVKTAAAGQLLKSSGEITRVRLDGMAEH